MIKKPEKLSHRRSLLAFALGLLLAAYPTALSAQQTGPQQLAFAGLRSVAQQGQFNAVRVDSIGNLYLLLDQKDGVRLLKTNATATIVLAQALLGAAGDVGLAMTLDPAGNIYVTGTSTSGSLTATSGAAFANPVDTSVNPFVAKCDPSLNLDFVTFGGSGLTATTPIGFNSAPQFVTLANTGSTVLHLTNLVASADFSVTGDSNCPVLVPGASCLLTILFTPQVSTQTTGPRAGTIEITSDSSTSLEFLSLIGIASPSTLVFQPNALNFGVAIVGSTAILPLQITNAGATPATFNGIATTGNCPASGNTLAPNATCTLQIGFTPAATGIRTGALSVATSVSPTPLIATLTGVGTQSHLQINPPALSFGNTAVGSSASLSLTLANTGSASITHIAFAATGDYAVTSPCSFTTLSVGASCSVTIVFRPTTIGVRNGTVTITSSDPTSPNTVALTGTGIASGTASFSLTVNGSTTASQTIDASHPATYNLTLTPINGFTGTIVLACNGITSAPIATCSMQPASVTLNGSAQTASVTINTLTSAKLRFPINLDSTRRTATLCMLFPAALFFWRFRRTLVKRPASLLLAMLCTTLTLLAVGCGSGAGNLNLRVSPSGSYQYTVTASSTTGAPLTQTVTLNLTIP